MTTRSRAIPLALGAAGVLALAGVVAAVAPDPGPSAVVPTVQGAPAAPPAPPAAVCGSPALTGPASPPPGAVVVPAGSNAGFDFSTPGATYWFAPGVHTLAPGEYSQIAPGAGATLLGGPGAVLDGNRDNRYAITGRATGVTIRHLTIRNFAAPRDEGVVNHDSGDGWTVEHNTLTRNRGAALMAGARNRIAGNCLADNGQYGLNAYQSGNRITGLVVEGNEFTGNNTEDWEAQLPGCGCTGAMKFWAVNGADVRNNWIHGNHGTAVWADTNNNDFLIEDNLIEDNDGTGIFYEISYNAVIRGNTLRDNAWRTGREFAGERDPFPTGAIYLSEADGDARIPARTAKIEVTGNLLENNWGGVVAWANADRFCNSSASTTSDCTLIVGPENTSACSPPAIAREPLYTDCRWWTSDLEIHGNTFRFDPAAVDGGCPVEFCGRMALLSNYGSSPDWSPYQGDVIQRHIVFAAGNRWHDNTYTGPWRFTVPDMSTTVPVPQWTGAPYHQDAGSTFDGRPGR
ncbi:right-handed parallel beta-helix repeat-containing protein [Amycolatopsis methanolica]|uniref:right-handed parallel beta-helix repeat-containing protein n=1 Tax=Amycolatopsis methanolica TaxID=1814 RepID=UPI00342C8CC6